MPRTPNTLDRAPGTLPEISTTVDAICFRMSIPGVPKYEQLVIRCMASGEILMAIQFDGVGGDPRR